MSHRPQRIETAALLVFLVQGFVLGCPLAAAAQNMPGGASDTAMFSIVVRSIRDSFPRGRLLVEARPVSAVVELTTSPPELADVPPAEVSARREVLRKLSIADTSVVGIPSDCPGVLAPPSDSARKGCPKEQFTIVAIAVPRPANPALIKESRVRDVAGGAVQWAVRTIVCEIGPYGFTLFGLDYVMEFQNEQWRLVKRVSFGWIE